MHSKQSKTRGTKPIEKNIIVIDEQGNKYEMTYPKRAKGLVKNGRARFVNEKTICLACPPNKILEDNKLNNEVISSQEQEGKSILTFEYVLEQIEKIANQTSSLRNAIPEISSLSINSDDLGVIETQTKAITDIVRCCETTNQQLLKVYEKMYDDLKPNKHSSISKFNDLKQSLMRSNFIQDEYSPQAIEMLKNCAQQIFDK